MFPPLSTRTGALKPKVAILALSFLICARVCFRAFCGDGLRSVRFTTLNLLAKSNKLCEMGSLSSIGLAWLPSKINSHQAKLCVLRSSQQTAFSAVFAVLRRTVRHE